jgi:DNA-binding SARP family transcriptional activator
VPLLARWPAGGLGLTGPGAAARGMLVAVLATGVEDPQARTRVVVPSATLQALLGAGAQTLSRSSRLTVIDGLPQALQVLEEQTLHRTRVLFDHETDDVAALRNADPTAEPLPPLLLLADATAGHERARIAALLAQGDRLDLHGVLLGPWPAGPTIAVAADGTTTPADTDGARHAAHPTDIARLTVLTGADAADLAATLTESHGDPPPPMTGHAGPNANKLTTPAPDASRPPPSQAQRPAHDTEQAADQPAADSDSPMPHNGQARPTGQAPGTGTGGRQATGRARVTVLGHPAIDDSTAEPGEPLRAKSLELLVYLAVHGGSARVETILEDLLPDAPARKALYRLHTYVYSLRKTLVRCAGPGTYLQHPPGRYTLNPDTLDIDLWTMTAALTDAAAAATPADRIAALRRAVAAYTAPLAQDCDYEWIEPHRESIRQQALDAHLALADHPDQSLAVLTTAITHDPYAETAYQHAMRAHAALRQPDAIRVLLRTLTRCLDEIDAEPTDDTITLANQLTATARRSRPSVPTGPGRSSG